MDPSSPAAPPAAKRLTRTVFGSVALGMTGFYAAFTAAPLIAEDITGTARWSGLPGAAAILGTAGGAALLSEIMARRGRRPGLVAGWLVAAVGAIAAMAATTVGSFAALLAAMLVLGCGHGANQLARFAAADPQPPARRGRVLSLVVWAGTVGAVVGPNLLQPAARVVSGVGLTELTGGFMASLAVFTVAAAVLWVGLRPDPSELAAAPPPTVDGRRARLGRVTLVAVAALIVAQFVMVLIMTITPVHVRGHDHGLAGVGAVISLHVLGMFGLAPVAGWLSDRFGGLRVALAGLLLVAASGWGAAVAPPTSVTALAAALFVLGLGWSAAFVASSSLLASTTVTIQGRADALGWTCAALASITSGILLDAVGYALLCLVGIVLAVAAAGLVAHTLRREDRGEGHRFRGPRTTRGLSMQ